MILYTLSRMFKTIMVKKKISKVCFILEQIMNCTVTTIERYRQFMIVIENRKIVGVGVQFYVH